MGLFKDNLFDFPDSCRVDQRIAKVLFAENGPLTPGDRKTFQKEIEEVVCSYVLDSEQTGLNTANDDEHDYSCLAVIEVTLRHATKARRVAELCHRAMPYPLLVILRDADGKLMFSMAEKRFSRDGREQVVMERSVETQWYCVEELPEFAGVAGYGRFRQNNFLQLHTHYMGLLEALNCAAIAGELTTTGIAPAVRREALTEWRQLESELAAIKAQVKKESELATLVDLNLQAKRIEHKMMQLQKKLKVKEI